MYYILISQTLSRPGGTGSKPYHEKELYTNRFAILDHPA